MLSKTCKEHIFTKLFEEYSNDLFKLLRYKFGDNFNIQDITQDAFIKLWENCKDVPLAKAKGYLYRVGSNQILNEVKHEKVVLKYQKLHVTTSKDNQSPEFLLEEKEYLIKYQNALAKLSEAQRVAFLLNRADGKSYDEIATLLSISKKAVQKRVYGAIMNLKKEINF